jgi:hypothetical protein
MRYIVFHVEIRNLTIFSIQDNQVACYQTHTTPETHQIVRDNIHLSCHIQESRKGLMSSFSYWVLISTLCVRTSLLSIVGGQSHPFRPERETHRLVRTRGL